MQVSRTHLPGLSNGMNCVQLILAEKATFWLENWRLLHTNPIGTLGARACLKTPATAWRMLHCSRQLSFTRPARHLPPISFRKPSLISLPGSYPPNPSPMLTSRITLPAPSTPSQEDIFSSALSSLFTDDTQNNHGSPGGSLTYTSPVFGDIELQIPAHPDVEEGRKLFAHYLWNASLVVAEGIECASVGVGVNGDKNGQTDCRECGDWNSRWNVRERRVLELGAGMSLRTFLWERIKLSYGGLKRLAERACNINRHSLAVHHQRPLWCLQCHDNGPPFLACSHQRSYSSQHCQESERRDQKKG
jgi:hypothetical protein